MKYSKSRKSSKRGYKKSKKSTYKVAKTALKIARASRPQVYVCDDLTNDGSYLFAGPTATFSVNNTWIYKWWGLILGATASDPSLLNQGLMEGDVRGNEIRMLSMQVRGQVYLSDNILVTPDRSNAVRIMAYWDRSASKYNGGVVNNITFPAEEPIATFTGVNSQAGLGSIFSNLNPVSVGKGKRFSVLFDKVFQLCIQGKDGIHFEFTLPLNRKAGLSNAAGISSCLSQNVMFAFCSDSTTAPAPLISLNARLRYTT